MAGLYTNRKPGIGWPLNQSGELEASVARYRVSQLLLEGRALRGAEEENLEGYLVIHVQCDGHLQCGLLLVVRQLQQVEAGGGCWQPKRGGRQQEKINNALQQTID